MKPGSAIVLTEGTGSDVAFLEEMLYEAAFWRIDRPRPPLLVALADPANAKYVARWGRRGDRAVIATANGR